MKNLLVFSLAALAACLYAGCQSPRQTLVAQLGVMLATERVVQGHPERAAKVIAICDEVIALAGSDTATPVDVIVATVRARINWEKLAAESPTAVTAVNLLLEVIAAELNSRIAAGKLPAEYLVSVQTVAGWIRTAAQPFAPRPAPPAA